MSDILDTIAADAAAFEDLTTEKGSELSDLIRQASDVNKAISGAEEAVKSLKKTRDKYLYDLLPAKMTEIGMDKVEVDGNSVSLTTFVSATMPKDPLQKDLAIQHLRSIGCADFIKNKLEVSFGLKKLAKERLQAGQEFDTELFNAHIGTVAKIKGA